MVDRRGKGNAVQFENVISVMILYRKEYWWTLGQGSALLQDAYRHRATAVEGGESPFRSDAQCPYSQVPKVCLFSLVAERVFVFLKPALLSVTLSC